MRSNLGDKCFSKRMPLRKLVIVISTGCSADPNGLRIGRITGSECVEGAKTRKAAELGCRTAPRRLTAPLRTHISYCPMRVSVPLSRRTVTASSRRLVIMWRDGVKVDSCCTASPTGRFASPSVGRLALLSMDRFEVGSEDWFALMILGLSLEGDGRGSSWNRR